jgi:DNA-binding GntR family transcriptional regulator
MTSVDPVEAAPDGRGLTSIAFDFLRADVLNGVLKPQERLRVQALSARYQIGATAIREALSRLVTEGLVQVEDQRGFKVAPVSRADLIDLTDTRVDLESMTLTHAIRRGDTAWEADVMASYHRLSKCPPPTSAPAAATWGVMHRAFHETLLAGCGSVWLQTLCRLLYDKSERYRHLANIRTRSRTANRSDEHKELMEAVLRRDGPLACRLLAEHYQRTTEIILQSEEAQAMFERPKSPRGRAAANN